MLSSSTLPGIVVAMVTVGDEAVACLGALRL